MDEFLGAPSLEVDEMQGEPHHFLWVSSMNLIMSSVGEKSK